MIQNIVWTTWRDGNFSDTKGVQAASRQPLFSSETKKIYVLAGRLLGLTFCASLEIAAQEW